MTNPINSIPMKNKLFFLILLLGLACGPALSQNRPAQGLPFGVNLAGAEFGSRNGIGVCNVDYFYPTAEDLAYWQSKGLTLLRVPFKWERIQHELGGELTAEEVKTIGAMLAEAEKRGLHVILDMHNYGRRKVGTKNYIIGDSVTIEHLADCWGRIARAFGSCKSLYGYGLMNEPHDMLPSTPWPRIAQGAIFEIRKHDMETPVMVGGTSWSSADRWQQESADLKNLYDPGDNLIFEAHVYFDSDASGTYKRPYDEEGANPYIGVERLRPFVQWLKANDFRGFIGEYGIPADDERWQVCLDHFLDYLSRQGINGTYWAAGRQWGKYPLSVQPTDDYRTDKPQMKILTKYPTTE